MIGGMISSTLLTLIVIPAIFGLVKGFGLPAAGRHDPPTAVRREQMPVKVARTLEPAE
jgi:copper/silver efflux system protein